MNKKILILYTSVGLGHKSIAENIAWHLRAAGLDVKLADILEVQSGWLTGLGKKVHRVIITKFPWLWSFFYNSNWFTILTLPLRDKVASKNFQKTLEVITHFNPDIIITTQTTASAVVSFIKNRGLFKGQFGIAFSDFHLHRYWLYKTCDFYLVNIEEQKQEMVKLGIEPHRISVCGITLEPKVDIDIQTIKNKFSIKPREKIVLIASGSLGTGLDKNLINKFLGKPDIKAIVICGKNEKVFKELRQKFAFGNIVVLEYYSPMPELYAIANLFITKPGGLSTAEALQYKLPILVSHVLPGQELLNYDYLLKNRLVMPRTKNLLDEAFTELESGDFKKILENNPELNEILSDPNILVQAVNKALN